MPFTTRLEIRSIQEKDFEQLLKICRHAPNMQYIGDGKSDWTLNELMAKYKEFAYDEKTKIGLQVVVSKANGKLIGECGVLKNNVNSKKETEIRFLLDEEYWGRGLASEICRYLLPIAFEKIGLKNVKARLNKQNQRSTKLLKKFLFKKTQNWKNNQGVEFEDFELSQSNYFDNFRITDYFSQETDRLYFRKVISSDINHWIDFFENNSSLKYLGVDMSKSNEANAEEWIMTQLDRYQSQGLGHLGIIEKSSNQFIGMAGIIPRVVDDQKYIEIAYSLKPRSWGIGYGTETASQLRKYGFENRISNRFISIIDKRNLASIKVAQKNGMEVLFETRYLGMDVFVFGVSG